MGLLETVCSIMVLRMQKPLSIKMDIKKVIGRAKQCGVKTKLFTASYYKKKIFRNRGKVAAAVLNRGICDN